MKRRISAWFIAFICTALLLFPVTAASRNGSGIITQHFLKEANVWFAFGMTSLLIISIVIIIIMWIHIKKNNLMHKKHDEQHRKYEQELRVALDSANETSRMKSIFLANMSHEIRTPMNAIIGFSELALDDSISPNTRDYLEKINASSEGLLQIINDILDISKIEAGQMVLENIPFNINEVFKICQMIIYPKTVEKGLELLCHSETSMNMKLTGDPTKLRQVLLNLLSNAVKFTSNGIVKLMSAVEKTTEDSVTIRFDVEDSGIGISAKQIKRIFEPFKQADDSTTRKYGGTGLGLSIAKMIIDQMGGKLNVASTEGIGSKFWFSLTFKTVDEMGVSTDLEMPAELIKKPVFKGEILVCEDNAMNRQVICDHLSRVGLKSIAVDNGKICVDMVARRMQANEPPFDLIFMDIYMPVMDGLEASENLLELGCKTPIIALTANVMQDDREVYKAHGMQDFLTKPFKTQELWSCLMKHLVPKEVTAVSINEPKNTDEELQNRMKANFVNDNRNTFMDIVESISEGDIKRAHRIAHSLKSVAGLIGKIELQKAAEVVERALANDKSDYTEGQMEVLEYELKAVIEELEPLTQKIKQKPRQVEKFSSTEVSELLKELDELLSSSDTECLDFIDSLSAIPGTEKLIEQIDKFDFVSASEILSDIKQKLEV